MGELLIPGRENWAIEGVTPVSFGDEIESQTAGTRTKYLI